MTKNLSRATSVDSRRGSAFETNKDDDQASEHSQDTEIQSDMTGDPKLIADNLQSNKHVEKEIPDPRSYHPNTGSSASLVEPGWYNDILEQYKKEVEAIEKEELELARRAERIGRGHCIWIIQGQQAESARSVKRIKTRLEKVRIENAKAMEKERKLEMVVSALRNVVGMLEESDTEQ
jgi:hypothetical protein